MREHMGLFRGKRCDNGEWVTGFYVRADHHWHNYGIHKDWIICGASANGGWFALHNKYPVKSNTIGECTSLKDKNGKLIFEGDVVRVYGDDLPHWIDYGEIREVKYRNGAFTPFDEYDSDCNTFVLAGDCEIIGNIHDNPELKGGEG